MIFRKILLVLSLLCILSGAPDNSLWKNHPVLPCILFAVGVVGLNYLIDGDRK